MTEKLYDTIMNNPANIKMSLQEIITKISLNQDSNNLVGKYFNISSALDMKLCVVLNNEGIVGVADDPRGEFYYKLLLDRAFNNNYNKHATNNPAPNLMSRLYSSLLEYCLVK